MPEESTDQFVVNWDQAQKLHKLFEGLERSTADFIDVLLTTDPMIKHVLTPEAADTIKKVIWTDIPAYLRLEWPLLQVLNQIEVYQPITRDKLHLVNTTLTKAQVDEQLLVLQSLAVITTVTGL